MKLVDMKRPKKNKKELNEEATIGYAGESERYPYGLKLCFEDEEIEKLDVLKDVKAEQAVKFDGIGKITLVEAVDAAENSGRRKRRRVEIQVEKIAVMKKSDKKLEEMEPEEYRDWRNGKA
jgi:hypothetical protein